MSVIGFLRFLKSEARYFSADSSSNSHASGLSSDMSMYCSDSIFVAKCSGMGIIVSPMNMPADMPGAPVSIAGGACGLGLAGHVASHLRGC